MFYSFRRLATAAEFEEFKRGYDSQVAHRSEGAIKSVVQIEYLEKASLPIACFDRRGRMVAGFVVQKEEPLIILGAMPPEVRDAYLAGERREELCELTAIWRNDGISADLFAGLVWPKIILTCVTAGRKYILGIGYQNTLNDIYRRIRPRLVYQGPHQVQEGIEIFVYAYTKTSICMTLVSNLVIRKLLPACKALFRRRADAPSPKHTRR